MSDEAKPAWLLLEEQYDQQRYDLYQKLVEERNQLDKAYRADVDVMHLQYIEQRLKLKEEQCPNDE